MAARRSTVRVASMQRSRGALVPNVAVAEDLAQDVFVEAQRDLL